MKAHIESLSDALCYLLTGMLFIESNLASHYRSCKPKLSSPELKDAMERYLDVCHDNRLKIDRVFNYLMKEPEPRENEVFKKMINETEFVLRSADEAHLKDVLFIGCIESLISYKASTYRTAYLFSAELELDTPDELIQQILESEYASRKLFSNIAVKEFNKVIE